MFGLDDNTTEQWSQELRLSGVALQDSLDWVVGAYFFEEDAVNSVEVPLFRGVAQPDCAVWPIGCTPFPFPFLDLSPVPFLNLAQIAQALFQVGGSRRQIVDAGNSSQAVFGEISWRFREDWSVTAGARYTRDKRDFRRTEVLSIGIPDPTLRCPAGTPPPVDGTTCQIDKRFSETTPRIILSYDLSEDVMLYAGWSKGYSSGGFNQDVAMRPFDPEISSNWEGGVKSLLFDRRLLLNLTAFHNTYENQQITVGRIVNSQPTADLINAQEATLYGLEGEFRAELPDGFYVLGSFGILDGEYEEFNVQDNGVDLNFEPIVIQRDLSHTEVVRVSPVTYSIAVGNSRTLANGASLNAQLGWAFRGRTYNTLEALRSSRQGKYGLLDGRLLLTLPNGQTSISLWGTNLLDRTYFQSAIDLTGGFNPTFTNTKYWGEPRRFGIEFSHRFGG